MIDHGLQGLPQPCRIQPATQLQAAAHVIGSRGRIHLPQEPLPHLCKRQHGIGRGIGTVRHGLLAGHAGRACTGHDAPAGNGA